MEMAERILNTYNYIDYTSFPDEMKCEIIDGEVYMMSPARSFIHQTVSLNIASSFSNQLKGKRCKPAIVPLNVFLDYCGEINDCRVIIQPDVIVVCDQNKIDKRGILGIPNLTVEVISPSSIIKDTRINSELFERFKVPEYWLVFPELQTIVVSFLENDKYKSISYIYEKGMELSIQSKSVSELLRDLSVIFVA